jgi:hypothetical protein
LKALAFAMDTSKGVTRRAVKNFQLESLDDPSEDEALDRAFGQDTDAISAAVLTRRDNQPTTTQKEIWGWYLYEGANQPYSRYDNQMLLECYNAI